MTSILPGMAAHQTHRVEDKAKWDPPWMQSRDVCGGTGFAVDVRCGFRYTEAWGRSEQSRVARWWCKL